MADLDKQQPKTQEYYGNYPNFRVASGIKIPDGDLKGEYVDYSVTTDNLQGMAWYKNGQHKLVVNNCSYEYVGEDNTDKDMSKIILAKNGNIKIECKNGDIELAAANIHLKATEEIKFSTPAGILDIQASVFNIKATTVNVLARHQLTMCGQFVDIAGATSCNIDTMDTKQRAKFAGNIMTVLNNKILNFFKSL
tara:strand:+ start:1203 stop:1784 length:582 start_codon:yes stop_codon:yes gene_type:complete